MLQFKQSDTATELILTLSELVTLAPVNYLFVFTHVTQKDEVKFVKTDDEDESDYPARYNQFTINPSVVFLNKQPGQWHYKVYEQASEVNTNPALAGELIEQGKMILDRATDFSFTMYDAATSFKTYNG